MSAANLEPGKTQEELEGGAEGVGRGGGAQGPQVCTGRTSPDWGGLLGAGGPRPELRLGPSCVRHSHTQKRVSHWSLNGEGAAPEQENKMEGEPGGRREGGDGARPSAGPGSGQGSAPGGPGPGGQGPVRPRGLTARSPCWAAEGESPPEVLWGPDIRAHEARAQVGEQGVLRSCRRRGSRRPCPGGQGAGVGTGRAWAAHTRPREKRRGATCWDPRDRPLVYLWAKPPSPIRLFSIYGARPRAVPEAESGGCKIPKITRKEGSCGDPPPRPPRAPSSYKSSQTLSLVRLLLL